MAIFHGKMLVHQRVNGAFKLCQKKNRPKWDHHHHWYDYITLYY